MHVYVEAIGYDGYEILGNLDGQRSWKGKNFRRTNWFKNLPNTKTLNDRVAFWKIVDKNGSVICTVFPNK